MTRKARGQNRTSATRSLSRMQIDRIGMALVPLGERSFVLADQLRKNGFSAFVPCQRFLESFARDSTDLEVHRKYVVERAKLHLARPGPIWAGADNGSASYRSEFIDQLTSDAHASALAAHPSTAWIPKVACDPCEIQSHYTRVANRAEYDRRHQAMLEQRTNQLAHESQRNATGISARYPLGMILKPSRFKFVSEVLERETTPLGFLPTDMKASRGDPIVAKQIADGWTIGWAIDDPGTFYVRPTDGILNLNLHVRCGEGGRPAQAVGPGQYLFLKYSWLVDEFHRGYMAFEDLGTLETHVKAYMCLYGLIAPFLERVVAEQLQAANATQ